MSLMRDAIGVLLAGGQGERLWPLARDRATPAVPFGGIYRIIDLTLSNCINSNLRRVFVLTQYKALSLNRHVREGWSSLMGLGEYIEVLTPQMRVSANWYLGTADAVLADPSKQVPVVDMLLSADVIGALDDVITNFWNDKNATPDDMIAKFSAALKSAG